MLSSATVLAIFTSAALGFFLLNALLRLTPPLESHVTASKQHKWRNEVVSLVHSVIVGLGALYCWILSIRSKECDQSYFADIEIFGAISAGYTVYDAIDLVQNDPLWKVLGLLVHHIAVFGCFFTTYVTGRFYNLNISAMMVDFSSIFLHLRMLFIMHGFDKEHPLRALNAFINVLMFIVCRLGAIIFILINVLLEPELAVIVKVVTPLLVFSLFILNLVLFRRLIVSDYISKKSSPSSSSSSSSSSCDRDVDVLDTS